MPLDSFSSGQLALSPASCEQAMLDIAQYRQTGLGIIEHVPGLAATGLNRLHVVLNADNRVGQAIRFFLFSSCRPPCFSMS